MIFQKKILNQHISVRKPKSNLKKHVEREIQRKDNSFASEVNSSFSTTV